MSERDDIDVAAFEEWLVQRREELHSLSARTDDARKPVALDQQSVGRLSRMDAMQLQAMAQETERRRAGELQRIEATLRRITAGEFGYCTRCGEDIPAARLALDPTASTCVDCAGKSP
jgi:DnaK suppressor protein